MTVWCDDFCLVLSVCGTTLTSSISIKVCFLKTGSVWMFVLWKMPYLIVISYLFLNVPCSATSFADCLNIPLCIQHEGADCSHGARCYFCTTDATTWRHDCLRSCAKADTAVPTALSFWSESVMLSKAHWCLAWKISVQKTWLGLLHWKIVHKYILQIFCCIRWALNVFKVSLL